MDQCEFISILISYLPTQKAFRLVSRDWYNLCRELPYAFNITRRNLMNEPSSKWLLKIGNTVDGSYIKGLIDKGHNVEIIHPLPVEEITIGITREKEINGITVINRDVRLQYLGYYTINNIVFDCDIVALSGFCNYGFRGSAKLVNPKIYCCELIITRVDIRLIGRCRINAGVVKYKRFKDRDAQIIYNVDLVFEANDEKLYELLFS